MRDLARRIDDEVRRAEADDADSDLIDELRSTVAEVFAWDEPAASVPTPAPAVPAKAPEAPDR